jgi:DNA/RNA-binding domain of Phe-tRNA-synthetase-like protein
MNVFQYSTDILKRFPTIVGGVILARDMANGPTPAGLQAMYQTEQQAILQHIRATPLSQIPSLAAWRNAFRSFDVDPTQYRSAAEALLRRLTKKGDIPGINLLVDLGNLVSIRYGLPVAIFDTRALQGTVTVHFADGSERYTTLGETGVGHPEPGEVVFSDESGLVIARRWCWRQSEHSAANAETRNAIITVEAHHAGGHHDIEAALNNLLTLLETYAGGNFISRILDAEHPALAI